MKKILCILLLLALCVAPLAYAKAEAAAQPVGVSFDKLPTLVAAGNPNYQKELQEIRKTEISIGSMQQKLDELNKDWSANVQAIISLQPSLWAAEERLEELNAALEDKVKQHVYPVQRLYLNHYVLTIDVEIARRELAALEKDLSSAKQKLSRGLITQSTVNNAEKSVKTQKDAVKATQTKVDDNLEALAKSLGLEEDIVLEGLPAMDFGRITGRDQKADLAAYIPAASATAEKARKAAKETAEKSGSSADWYAYTIASQDYEKAKKEAEKAFPKVYQTLRDAYDEMVASTAVSDAQREYDRDKAQFARGMIAQNRLLSAERALQNAQSRQKQQEIQVWLSLLEYEYNLIKF